MIRRLAQNVVGHIRENLLMCIVILFFFVAGIISGSYTIAKLSEEQLIKLSYFLSSFFALIKDQTPDILNVLLQSLANNFKLIASVAFCGLTVFFLPVMLILIGIKGFMIGFTVSALVMQFGFAGILVSLICILPPNIVIVFAYLRLGVDSSLNGIMNHRRKRLRGNTQRLSGGYMKQVLKISLFCMLGVIIESVMTPFVLRLFAGIM